MTLRRKLVLLGTVAFATAAGWYLRVRAAQPARTAAAPSGTVVATVKVTQRDLPVWLTGLGTVQAYNTVTVRPRVGGTLDRIDFTEGQVVAAGDVLAQIDPRPYQSALDQARARQAQNEAQLANVRQDLERTRQLAASQAISRQLLDQTAAVVAGAEALVQADRAGVAAAALDLEFTTMRAPIAGRTGVRLIDAGNLVSANQATGLVVITQIHPVSIVFTLGQQQLSILRHGMTSSPEPLVVEAFSPEGAALARGELELIDNQIDSATGTIRLKARFANDDQALWPGQFVSARVRVQTLHNATVVPSEVVQAGIDGPYAYAVKSDLTVEVRALKTGLAFDGLTVIESGLAPGEEVVREGQTKLQPGAPIARAREGANEQP